jgi:hypothetical protein
MSEHLPTKPELSDDEEGFLFFLFFFLVPLDPRSSSRLVSPGGRGAEPDEEVPVGFAMVKRSERMNRKARTLERVYKSPNDEACLIRSVYQILKQLWPACSIKDAHETIL